MTLDMGLRRKNGRAGGFWDIRLHRHWRRQRGLRAGQPVERGSAQQGRCCWRPAGEDDYLWIKIPVGYLYCIGNPRTDWCFNTEVEPHLNARQINYPRGRVLGGCSSINGMIYMRGQARDYDLWRQAGNIGWAWDDVLPFFKKSEDHVAGASELHGAGGELRVERQRLRWEMLEAFREAAAQYGVPKTADFNTRR